jgi:ABC-2 type transport system permease protein
LTEVRGIYTLWLREVKRYIRDRVRVVTGLITPMLWLLIFGSAVRVAGQLGNLTYQQYLLPGVMGQALMFTSMFVSISVIWDREFGFMKEILVAPISRVSIFVGKMLGDSTDALIQGTIVLIIGAVLGITANFLGLIEALPIMVLITFGFVGLGVTIASFMTNLESYGVITTLVNLPLFFLSGALFPIRGPTVPEWLQVASMFNPLTYGVDALRIAMLGEAWQPLYPLYYDLFVMVIFDVIMIAVGTVALSRRR